MILRPRMTIYLETFVFRVVKYCQGSKLIIDLLKKLYEGLTAAICGSKACLDVLCSCRQGGLESPTPDTIIILILRCVEGVR